MAISVNDYYNSSSRKGVSGLVSGLDTDEIIKGMTMGTTSKINSQLQQKQIAVWKQEAYRDITKKLNSFQSKYLSYSAGKNNILSSDFFNTEKVKTESKYVKISGNTNTIKNLVINDIKQLATTSNITTSKKLSNHEILGSSQVMDSWNKADLGKASITVSFNDKNYTVNLGETSFKKDATDAEKIAAITDTINKAIENTADLKGKFKAEVTADNKFSFSAINQDGSANTSGNFSISSSTENIQTALGIPASSTASTNGVFTAETVADVSKIQKNVTLADELAGKSLEINLNGVKKTITFNETDKDQYNTADKMVTYLKNKIDKSVGAGKVNVSLSSGNLSINTASNSDILTISGTDKGLLGENSALGISSGCSNRIQWNKSIKELKEANELDGLASLTADKDGNYALKINGVEIKVNENDTMSKVFQKINNSDANVKIDYSTLNDTVKISAKDSGATGAITVEGDFASVLFGNATQQTSVEGTDAIINISIDGKSQEVVRSTNSFEIDGANIELLGKADGTEAENIKFEVESNIDETVTKIKDFVKDYNELVETINKYVTDKPDKNYQPLTSEQKSDMEKDEIDKWEEKAKTGILFGDSTLTGLLSNLRGTMYSVAENSKLRAFDIGITTTGTWTDGGKLAVDEDKLKKALSEDKANVESLFNSVVGEGENNNDDLQKCGIMVKLNNSIKRMSGSFVGNDGKMKNGALLEMAGKVTDTYGQDTLSKKIRDFDSTVEKLKLTLKSEQERYYNQFTYLEQYMQQMNSQSNWLSQQFSGTN